MIGYSEDGLMASIPDIPWTSLDELRAIEAYCRENPAALPLRELPPVASEMVGATIRQFAKQVAQREAAAFRDLFVTH